MAVHYEHLLRKSRDAKRGGHEAWAVQSTGEKVAVALVLDRADWLAEMQYTLAEIPTTVRMICAQAGSLSIALEIAPMEAMLSRF